MNILSNLKKDQMKLRLKVYCRIVPVKWLGLENMFCWSWTFGHTIHNMLINFFYNSLKGISVDFT